MLYTFQLSQEALQYWVSFVPWSIYWPWTEYDDSFRMAYAQIDKSRIEEAIQRFDSLVRS